MNDYERKILRHIEDFGCSVTSVFDPEGDNPPFTYSIGIARSTGAPELIVVGLESKISHWLVNEYRRRCQAVAGGGAVAATCRGAAPSTASFAALSCACRRRSNSAWTALSRASASTASAWSRAAASALAMVACRRGKAGAFVLGGFAAVGEFTALAGTGCDTALPITLLRTRPLDEAISSAGGVPFAELDAGLMLKTLPGVFCAGEMLDWEAPTGGYLLTACFASGRMAGKGAAAFVGARLSLS